MSGIILSTVLFSLLAVLGRSQYPVWCVIFFHTIFVFPIWFGTWTKEWEQSLLWKHWNKQEKGKGYEIARWLRN
jgi:hypothetical protein